MFRYLDTYKVEMKSIEEAEKKIKKEYLLPMNKPPKDLAPSIANSIRRVPDEYKNSISEKISNVKKVYDRYKNCLESFDKIYVSYYKKLNASGDDDAMRKFNSIVRDWSYKIEDAFPQLRQFIQLLQYKMDVLGTSSTSDLHSIMWYVPNAVTYKDYIKELIWNWHDTKRRFLKEYLEIKERLPEKSPEIPKTQDFSAILLKEFGPLPSILDKIAEKFSTVNVCGQRRD